MSPTKSLIADPVGRALLEGMRRRYSVSSMSILEYVFAADRPCTISEIVEATKLRPNTVSSLLTREARKDILEPVGRGVYQRSPRTYDAAHERPQHRKEEAPQPIDLSNFKLELEPSFGL